jgi:hypothetical protein
MQRLVRIHETLCNSKSADFTEKNHVPGKPPANGCPRQYEYARATRSNPDETLMHMHQSFVQRA